MSAIADELQKLAELRTAGSLTADEYLEAKALVLSGRQPAKPRNRTPESPPPPENYGLATAAFVLGLVALPFAWLGAPIAAGIVSLCALVGIDTTRHKNFWMALAGLLLSLLGGLAMLSAYRLI